MRYSNRKCAKGLRKNWGSWFSGTGCRKITKVKNYCLIFCDMHKDEHSFVQHTSPCYSIKALRTNERNIMHTQFYKKGQAENMRKICAHIFEKMEKQEKICANMRAYFWRKAVKQKICAKMGACVWKSKKCAQNMRKYAQICAFCWKSKICAKYAQICANMRSAYFPPPMTKGNRRDIASASTAN